jgi:carbamoyltransferase
MSVILGINAFHADSAACLVIDGILESAIAEERLGKREKHSPRFPTEAIRRVLRESGVTLKDVTHVAIARDPKSNYAAKARYVFQNPLKGVRAVSEHFTRNTNTQHTLSDLPAICDTDPATAKYQVVNVEHHLAHIASAYYLSPYESLTAGFSYDGSGDFVSLMAARCEGTKIEILDRVHLPYSLGFFYTALCQFIGFDEFGEEYKVMGLAPYGENEYSPLMREMVSFDDDSWFRLSQGFFGMHDGGESGVQDDTGRIVMGTMYGEDMVERLGKPRKRGLPLTQREKNIARSCQVRFEEVAIHCINRLHALVPTERIVMAGGCALNGVTNARILRESAFRQMYLQCAASDDGTCLGAAYYCYHHILGGTKRYFMDRADWGPEYSDTHIKCAAEASGLPVAAFSDETALLQSVAKLIAGGQVVGWYQGRSEWGPRALGYRSILANPAIPTMKETINTKIKRRESFRPFAPSVLKECVSTYFEQDIQSPFMMHVVRIRQEWREKLPAIAHVDGTGRLQTVGRESNPRYYALIEAFKNITGLGIMLNTSFNENEPIVDTPEQAVACFLRTDMDALCLGNYLLVKPDSRKLGTA